MRVLGIVGSLRAGSSNAAILRAFSSEAPIGAHVELYDGLGDLPHFNPDLDEEGAVQPPPVAELRRRIDAAGAVVICAPEYAHGVPGALKNALDWLVSAGELVGKRVAVLTAGPGGGPYAHTQLIETLRTMSWTVVEAASLRLTLGRAQLDRRGEVADPDLRRRLGRAAVALTQDERACDTAAGSENIC